MEKLNNEVRRAVITNRITGQSVNVVATTDHPDSHYGQAVWVDEEGVAYSEVDGSVPNPFFEVLEQ